jgi:hypothetical protein
MNRFRRLLPAALLPLALAAPETAAAAAFGPAQTLPLPATRQVVAAVGPLGAAVVAAPLGGAPVQARIEVASRSAAGGPWRIAGFATSALVVRDVQVAIGRSGPVVAWGEAGRHSAAVVIAGADGAGRLTVRGRFPVRDALSSYPRLAVLRSGAVVAAWRERLFHGPSLVRVATLDGGRFSGAPRTAGTDAAQIVLAARGGSATVGWVSPFRATPGTSGAAVGQAPHTLTVRSLDRRGLPAGPIQKAGSDVGTTARLAGSPDGRLVASWLRPQRNSSAQQAFTRQLLPRARPARPLVVASEISAGVPTVAFDGAGHVVAAVRSSAPAAGPFFDVRLSGSSAGGPWSSPRLIAPLGFSRFDPVVAAPGAGDAVVVYTALVQAPGTPAWTVGATDAAGTHPLGVTTGGDGRGIAVARAPGRVLVAWPTATGVQVAERG